MEGWRAHTERLGAKDFSRGESEVQDALRTLPDDPLSDSDEVDEALAVTKTRL